MEEKNAALTPKTCPFCKAPITEDAYFCPNCGKKLRNKPPGKDLLHQIGIYALSVLLPPLGLIPAIRYLRQDDKDSKIIGMIALFLTVVASAITIYYSVALFNQVNGMLNSQLNLNQMGY